MARRKSPGTPDDRPSGRTGRPEKDSNQDYRCPVAVTLDVIGGKWKAVIIWHLTFKTLRFSQLQRRLPRITQKMLTQQLRELERDGMVHRKVYPEVPPRVEYSLTEAGTSLKPLVTRMCQWGRDHLTRTGKGAASSSDVDPVDRGRNFE